MAWFSRYMNLIIAAMAVYPSVILIQTGIEKVDKYLVVAGSITLLICITLSLEFFAESIRKALLKALLGEKGKQIINLMEQQQTSMGPTMLPPGPTMTAASGKVQFSVSPEVQFAGDSAAPRFQMDQKKEKNYYRDQQVNGEPSGLEYCSFRSSDQFSGLSDLQSLELLSNELPSNIGKRLVIAGFKSATHPEQTLQYCVDSGADSKQLICSEIMPGMDLISHGAIQFSAETSARLVHFITSIKSEYSQVIVFLPQADRSSWQTVALRANTPVSNVVIEDLYNNVRDIG